MTTQRRKTKEVTVLVITVPDKHPSVSIEIPNTDELVHTLQRPAVSWNRSPSKRTVKFVDPTTCDLWERDAPPLNVDQRSTFPSLYSTNLSDLIQDNYFRHATISPQRRSERPFQVPYKKRHQHSETKTREEGAALSIINAFSKLPAALWKTSDATHLAQRTVNTITDDIKHRSIDTAPPSSAPDADAVAKRIFLTYSREDVWLDRFMESLDRWRALDSFARAMKVWGMTQAEMAGYLGVSGGTIDDLLDHSVPSERRGAIADLAAATDILVRYLKRDRIRAVVRRPSRALDGDSLTNLLERGDTRGVLSACRDMFRFERAHA